MIDKKKLKKAVDTLNLTWDSMNKLRMELHEIEQYAKANKVDTEEISIHIKLSDQRIEWLTEEIESTINILVPKLSDD